MGIEVRTIVHAELAAWSEAMKTGFLSHPVEGEADRRRPVIELDRTWAAFDGAKVVATLRSMSGSATVPGGATAPTALLTAVAVTATHRRQGLLTSMLEPDLQQSKERGEPLGALIAAEYPIYGRFGYGPATEHLQFVVDAVQARLRSGGRGSVELVSAAELREPAAAIFERHRRASVGELTWPDYRWDWELGLKPGPFENDVAKQFFLLARDVDGSPTAFARYKVKDTWEARVPRVELELEQLISDSPNGLALVWRFLLGIDWVTKITVHDRGPEELLPWLLVDARHARLAERADFLWIRLLDTPAALTLRPYTSRGRVVLEVVDRQGLAGGRFELDGGPDGATCAPSSTSADLTLGVDSLGALYLGGVSLRTLARAGRVDEHAAGAIDRADAMFKTPTAPWCSTWF